MAKAGFWKPGAPAPLSLEVDRGGELGVVHFGGEDAAGLAATRERLPIAALRSHLLYLVENHQVTVVVGATGCGKTTQLPQFLVEAGWAAGGRPLPSASALILSRYTVAPLELYLTRWSPSFGIPYCWERGGGG